jgi:hypothetical protein
VKDKAGKVPPIDWEIKFLNMSVANYSDISDLPQEGQDYYDMDIVMTRRKQGRGYSFRAISPRPRWTTNPELVAEVKEACEAFLDGKALTRRLGKKLNPLEWKALLMKLQASSGDVEEASMDNLNDL